LRQALGTQQAPPNQVLIGLALFLTAFVMMPVWQKIDTQALAPYLNEDISQAEAFEKAKSPLRSFMLALLAMMIGVGLGARVLIHFALTGQVSPLLPSAIMAGFGFVFGLQLIALGLIAGMSTDNRTTMSSRISVIPTYLASWWVPIMIAMLIPGPMPMPVVWPLF